MAWQGWDGATNAHKVPTEQGWEGGGLGLVLCDLGALLALSELNVIFGQSPSGTPLTCPFMTGANRGKPPLALLEDTGEQVPLGQDTRGLWKAGPPGSQTQLQLGDLGRLSASLAQPILSSGLTWDLPSRPRFPPMATRTATRWTQLRVCQPQEKEQNPKATKDTLLPQDHPPWLCLCRPQSPP
jgi:hypothetical protein